MHDTLIVVCLLVCLFECHDIYLIMLEYLPLDHCTLDFLLFCESKLKFDTVRFVCFHFLCYYSGILVGSHLPLDLCALWFLNWILN